MTHGQGRIEATLFFRRVPALPADLEPAIVTALGRFGHRVARIEPDGAGGQIFDAADLSLTLRLSPVPADPAPFAAMIDASFARIRPNDYAGRLAANRGTVTLALAPASTLTEADAIRAAHAALAATIRRIRPEAIAWSPNDTLFLPEEIPAADPAMFPASLALRPEIRMASADPAGRRRHGFVAGNAERWFGKALVVEPTTVPLPETLAFVDLCLIARMAGEDILARPATLRVTETLSVTVRHQPPGRVFPAGHIALAFHSTGDRIRVRPPVAPAPPLRPEALAAAPRQAGGPAARTGSRPAARR
ncbi:MAG: hypothetical protein N2422_08715 [Rhodobacteraceae bacterium]|nr:hypothetical protein [Paracoccaceae bacterium]